MYDFDVFLLTHNNLARTIDCLEGNYLSDGLYKNTIDFSFRLTVLDDSTDLTPEYFKRLSKEKDNIQYLNPGRPFKNVDEMYNLALARTDCPYIVLLTNSSLVEPSWIGSALKIMESNPKVAVIGFKTIRPDRLIENAGVLIFGNEVRCIGMGEPGHRYSAIYQVDAVGGCASLFRREAIKDGFDFSYYLPFGGLEDIDYCCSLKNKGWEIIYCGYGSVYHIGAATRGQDENGFWDKFKENKKRFRVRWSHLLDRETGSIKVMQ